MITQTFNLNMIPEQAPTVIHCDQYDIGEGRLIAKLYDGATPYTPSAGATAVIQGMKPDNHGFIYSATISGNTVTADLTKQMSVVAGRVFVQIVVTETDDRTGSFVFFLDVQRSALPDDSELSESDLSYIEELIETAQSITSNFPYIGANGNWWYYDVNQGAYVDSGVDASITIEIGSTTTLPAGSAATVTNSGTATDPIFNFGIPQGPQGNPGTPGVGIPSGGTTGQILQKSSNDDYATTWGNLPPGEGVPAGGTTGQVLAKKSNTDYDTEWINQSGGVDKADKVVGAVAGDFAGLDASGNLTDSGKKASDFATTADITEIVPKNLFYNQGVSKTINDVTITINDDRSVTFNGTPTANFAIVLYLGSFKAGNYLVSCKNATAKAYLIVGTPTENFFTINTDDSTSWALNSDLTNFRVRIQIITGTTFNNYTLYPMIRYSFVADDTYVPYHLTAEDVTFTNELNGYLGAKNLLNYTKSSETINGITWTVNADKTISYSGNPTALSLFTLYESTTQLPDNIIPGKTYKVSIKSSNIYACVEVHTYVNGQWVFKFNGPNDQSITIDSDAVGFRIRVYILSGAGQISGTLYPMIRFESDTDDTYHPYAMTNQELTEVKSYTVTATNLTSNAEATSVNVEKWGKIVSLSVLFKTTANVSIGSSIAFSFSGLPKPASYVSPIIGYKGSTELFGLLNTTPELWIRVFDAAIGSGETGITVCGYYFSKE